MKTLSITLFLLLSSIQINAQDDLFEGYSFGSGSKSSQYSSKRDNDNSHSNTSKHSNNSNQGEKVWKEQLDYGMFAINREKNGIRNRTVYGPCKMCRGTVICSNCAGMKICMICQGRGGIITSGYGRYIACVACNMTGRCNICQGTGKCPCSKYEYPGYTPGYATIYGVDGSVISNTNFGSGGSSSSSRSSSSGSSNSSSRSSCSACRGTGVDLSPSSGGNLTKWVAHHNSSDQVCPFCNRTYEHWHTRCASCNVPR